MLKERSELEKNLISAMKETRIKHNKKIVDDIKFNLIKKYKVLDAQKWIDNPEEVVPELDTRGLFLLTEQIYSKTGVSKINPSDYFTDLESKKSRQYVGTTELENTIKFPLTLENFSRISQNEFVGVVPMNLIAQLSLSAKLHYNFEIQRESVKKKYKGGIVEEAKLVMQNVIEIEEHILNRTLKPTQLVYNAAIGTADHEEPELIFDDLTGQITITKGTILDIVDGYHRTKATEFAYNKQKNLQGSFILLLTNYSDEEAKSYQGQLAKATPIAQERAKELLSERMSDAVLKELIPKSELKGRVSQNSHLNRNANEIVTYKTLAETIDDEFNLEKMLDVYKVSGYLIKYFNILMGTFESEFNSNYTEVRKKSLINSSVMFVGYLILARRMMDRKMDEVKVIDIVSSLNFDRDNPMWQEIGVVNENGSLNKYSYAKQAVKEFFREVEI
ncbi:hypothetical protein LCM23_12945 [Cytobacillus kochii]|uniref:DNA sulfur modification protein DndB n=1 Tax=Cytobacillus kochii TaxID=859143 RepID=UPI001CD57B93|nr:DNA sulfur modification protein DndB [Cytobacillus kochii]MCA1027001.1 hypothetical protein [Cytobacillus kochii]